MQIEDQSPQLDATVFSTDTQGHVISTYAYQDPVLEFTRPRIITAYMFLP